MIFISAILARWGVPERLRAALAWALASIAVLVLLWALTTLYDRRVIERHEARQAEHSIKALDDAAEQRAIDAVINLTKETKREQVIAAAPAGPGLSNPERALGCERLRQRGNPPPACR